MGIIRDTPAGDAAVALASAAEIIKGCGHAHPLAVATALSNAWAVFRDARLDGRALAGMLAAVAEHAPVESLQSLAQLLAWLFGNYPEKRSHLFKSVTALVHRASRDGLVVGLVSELIHGLSMIAWTEINRADMVTTRLQLAIDCETRYVDGA